MNERTKILWLTPDKPDDISVGRRRIADYLEGRGYDVTLRGTTFRTFLRSIRDIGTFDVVIGTTRAGALTATLGSVVHRRPLIIDHIDPIRQFHETHPQWLAVIVRLLEDLSFLLADHVLYIYQEERERVSRYSTESTKTALGVEFDRFADPEDEIVTAARNRIQDLPTRDNTILYVGGLEPLYHIHELLEAMSILDDWSLLIIGDGGLREDVAAAATETDNIHYLGTVPHDLVPGFTRLADVGISLVDDPHTLKVLEYGAAGLPTVQIEGRADSRFGDKVEYCSLRAHDIAAAIRRAADSNGDELQSFIRRFEWADISDDYGNVITSVK